VHPRDLAGNLVSDMCEDLCQDLDWETLVGRQSRVDFLHAGLATVALALEPIELSLELGNLAIELAHELEDRSAERLKIGLYLAR